MLALVYCVEVNCVRKTPQTEDRLKLLDTVNRVRAVIATRAIFWVELKQLCERVLGKLGALKEKMNRLKCHVSSGNINKQTLGTIVRLTAGSGGEYCTCLEF